MRRLNSKEKETCRQIIGLDILTENIIEKNLLKVLKNCQANINFVIEAITLNIPPSEGIEIIVANNPNGRMNVVGYGNYERLFTTIVTTVKVLELLEAEGMIYLYKNRPDRDDFQIGETITGGRSTVQFTLIDQHVIGLLRKYLTHGIVVTEDLKLFIENKYVTRDEKGQKRQFNLSIAAILLSAIATFSTLAFEWIKYKKENKNNPHAHSILAPVNNMIFIDSLHEKPRIPFLRLDKNFENKSIEVK